MTHTAPVAAPQETLPDTLAKISGVLRKWQKQCKEYRERAKGRIVFRNFGKGDLALFLPTRGGGAGGGNGACFFCFVVFCSFVVFLSNYCRLRRWDESTSSHLLHLR